MGDPRHRVLVVDDDQHVRDVLLDALKDEGHDVRTLAHGRDALDLLLVGNWRPELILLDLRMPIMNGRDFRGMQLAADADLPIPIIVLSAVPDAALEASALEPIAVVAKPFKLDELLGIVHQVLAERS